jgi:hypothetical protein
LNEPFTNPIEICDLKLDPPDGGVVDPEGDVELDGDLDGGAEEPPGRQLGSPPGRLVGRHVSALGPRVACVSPRALDDSSIAMDNPHIARENTSAIRALPFCFMGHPPFYVRDLLPAEDVVSRHENLSP